MKKPAWTPVALVLFASAAVACSEPAMDDAGSSRNTGGTPGTGSAFGSGGAVGGGGVSASGAASGSGGSVGVGGLASGGASASGGAVGAGGATATGGLGSVGGSGGSAITPAVPSDGCGMGGRPASGESTGTNYISSFPESYDGSTPMPLVVGLHANGNQNTQIRGLTNNSRVASNFVRVFPKSTGSGWVYATDAARITAAYDDMLDKYCVDVSRVFVTGHSSGAQMAVQLLCNGDDRFKAAAPVAASKYCNSVDPIPVMYIQGIQDAQRGGSNGKDVVDMFASSNSCSGTTTPFPEVMGCTSSFNQKAVAPGCVSYQGCEAPLIWCSHNDEGYNATDGRYHGWPCFASNAMADFFMSLP